MQDEDKNQTEASGGEAVPSPDSAATEPARNPNMK